jgi:uncharacterized protein YjbI with pentapeptide repeats
VLRAQGGGPYGKQVTRGQDLTGKDFSGLTLVKQDFKTVYSSNCGSIRPPSTRIQIRVSVFALLQSILRQANFKGANLLGASLTS